MDVVCFVQGLGLRIGSVGFVVEDLGFRVPNLGFGLQPGAPQELTSPQHTCMCVCVCVCVCACVC